MFLIYLDIILSFRCFKYASCPPISSFQVLVSLFKQPLAAAHRQSTRRILSCIMLDLPSSSPHDFSCFVLALLLILDGCGTGRFWSYYQYSSSFSGRSFWRNLRKILSKIIKLYHHSSLENVIEFQSDIEELLIYMLHC